MKSTVASKSGLPRKSVRVVAVIAGAAAIAVGVQTLASGSQHHSVSAARQVSIAQGMVPQGRAHSALAADSTTSYDPGTDGWTLGDPYAQSAPVDPTTSYDPGTNGWTLGDPYANSTDSTSTYDSSATG